MEISRATEIDLDGIMIVISPDLALGILFVIAFAKTSPAAVTIDYARAWQ